MLLRTGTLAAAIAWLVFKRHQAGSLMMGGFDAVNDASAADT
jgi:hypothetical protein